MAPWRAVITCIIISRVRCLTQPSLAEHGAVGGGASPQRTLHFVTAAAKVDRSHTLLLPLLWHGVTGQPVPRQGQRQVVVVVVGGGTHMCDE